MGSFGELIDPLKLIGEIAATGYKGTAAEHPVISKSGAFLRGLIDPKLVIHSREITEMLGSGALKTIIIERVSPGDDSSPPEELTRLSAGMVTTEITAYRRYEWNGHRYGSQHAILGLGWSPGILRPTKVNILPKVPFDDEMRDETRAAWLLWGVGLNYGHNAEGGFLTAYGLADDEMRQQIALLGLHRIATGE